MKKIIAFTYMLVISSFGFGEISGWELVGFEASASPHSHTIITLEQTSNHEEELELNADIAANLVPDGQTTTFILRLLFEERTEEIPMVIRGGIGFLASPRSEPILRHLWPKQSIQVVDEKQLMQAFTKSTFHAQGINIFQACITLV